MNTNSSDPLTNFLIPALLKSSSPISTLKGAFFASWVPFLQVQIHTHIMECDLEQACMNNHLHLMTCLQKHFEVCWERRDTKAWPSLEVFVYPTCHNSGVELANVSETDGPSRASSWHDTDLLEHIKGLWRVQTINKCYIKCHWRFLMACSGAFNVFSQSVC